MRELNGRAQPRRPVDLNLSHLLYRYTNGWYEKRGAQLYVNRGIGITGFPIRLGARPEITVFELTRRV